MDDSKAYTKPWSVTLKHEIMLDTELIELFLGLDGKSAVVGDEIQVRQARRRRDNLGSADDQPPIGLLLHVHVVRTVFLNAGWVVTSRTRSP